MDIVIPTYEKHKQYNIGFLESIRKYCMDKESVVIHLIVELNTLAIFETIKQEFKDLNVEVHTLESLVENVDGLGIVLKFKNKYPLQSLKKLYSFSVVNGDYIVMDSENLCVKPFMMADIFLAQKTKPILYCKNCFQPIQTEVIHNSNILCDTNNNSWYFLKSYWFYEKELVGKLIDSLKKKYNNSLTLELQKITLFEYQLYCTFLRKNNLKEFLCVDDYLNQKCDFQEKLNAISANYEHVMVIINNDNVKTYCDIINHLDEKIIRLHWMTDNIKNKIIDETNVSIGTFHWD
jgi:hypothetical protein